MKKTEKKENQLGVFLALAILLSLLSFTKIHADQFDVTQQNDKITGKLLDATTQEPIIGANVVVNGTKNGTATNHQGEYQLNAPIGSKLTITSIGYKTTVVTSTAELQVTHLQEDVASLDEVIVVGYTTQRKESLTGAMQNIKSEKLKDMTSPSVENLLSSKVAGVYVAPGSGKPGDAGAVLIRGQVTLNGNVNPLWVIDGVIVGNGAGQLNPADIESLTVLKDAASTAIYGSQGANGVIVVTTKGAREGVMTIEANIKMGVSKLNNGKLKMMNGEQMYDYFSSFQNASTINFPRWNDDLRNSNFDWWDLATKSGFNQDYYLSIRGGNETLQSFFSVGYYNEEGAVKGYDYKRYSFNYKTVYKPFKGLTIKPSLLGSRRDVDDRQYDVTSMYSRLPWDSPYDENGELAPHRYSGWVNNQQTNYLRDLQWNKTKSTYYQFMGNLDFDVNITNWLTFASVNSYRYRTNSSHGYTDPRSNAGESVDGRLSEWRDEVIRRYTNQKLLFNKAFGKHEVTALLAYEFNDYKYQVLDVYGTGFIPGFEVLDVVAKPERTKGYILESAKQSYFINPKYAYDLKYLAEFSARRDGASNFGDNSKYGNFYSFSAGWVINREEWFKNITWVDQLKLRAAYGTVGNPPSEYYPQYDLYAVSTSYNTESGALISQIGNKDLEWEKTKAIGVGVDAAFFKNRLHFSIDYYKKKTDNILYKVPVSGLMGVTSVWRNIGKMDNNGIELSIGGELVRTSELVWGIDLNFSHNKNKLTDLFKQKEADGSYAVKPIIISGGLNIAGSPSRILEVGEPVDTYYMREWAGVDPETGAPTWYMNNAEGEKVKTSNSADATLYKTGNATPDLYGGFSTYLTWKNFNFNAVFGYSIGGKVFNYSRMEYDADGTYSDRNQMVLKDGWSRWTKPGDIATHPVAKYNNQDKGNIASTRYLEKNDYLKLRSLTLGYTLKLPQYNVKNLYMYMTAENLFTITKYSGVDPELPPVDGAVMTAAGPGIYPSVRKFMFGLNFSF